MPPSVSAPAAPSPTRRLIPWIVVVAALVAGITLCLVLGPRIAPFFLSQAA